MFSVETTSACTKIFGLRLPCSTQISNLQTIAERHAFVVLDTWPRPIVVPTAYQCLSFTRRARYSIADGTEVVGLQQNSVIQVYCKCNCN